MLQFRSLFFALCLLLAAPAARAQEAAADAEIAAASVPAASGTLSVRVSGLRSSDGLLSVALFNAKKGFPGKFERAAAVLTIPASAEPVVVFDKVPSGAYAVAVRHDENGNGKLDANFLGMPKEGVGVSNNPKSSFGPPSFKDASFVLEQPELELNIKLRYL